MDSPQHPTPQQIAAACKNPDWEQVILNGGPPCFHIAEGKFCFRAKRWFGHEEPGLDHPFVSLETFTNPLREHAEDSARLVKVCQEAIIRITDLFDRNERPSYITKIAADSDLSLILSTFREAIDAARKDKPNAG
jgi:hypothetical protein